MDERIEIREFEKEDAEALSEIIRKTWNYDRFCSSETAIKMARVYLYTCLCNQTYTRTALINSKPVGIIMGKNVDKHRCKLDIRLKWLKSLFSLGLSKEGRRTMRMFGGIDNLDEKMLKGLNKKYPGELSFFAIDSECRGHGIGRKLFEELKLYMEGEGIDEFYLFTDTSCNYKFYEHMGMRRCAEEDYTLHIADKSEKMTFFVYECSMA